MKKSLAILSYAISGVAILGFLGAGTFFLVIRYQYVKTVGPRSVELGDVSAYLERESYASGEQIPVYIHTTSEATARLYRLGQRLEPTDVSMTVPATVQSAVYHPQHGHSWKPTATLDATGLRSGYYYLKIVQISGDGLFCLPLVITPREPTEISVFASTNTWNAYNSHGGKSKYIDRVTPDLVRSFERRVRSDSRRKLLAKVPGFGYIPGKSLLRTFLPYHRPYVFDDDGDGAFNDFSREIASVVDPRAEYFSHLFRAEWSLPAFLEANGVEYGVYSDYDLAFDERLAQSKLWFFGVHSEYWSRGMIDRLEQYLDSGGHVIFASGNNIYREVDFYDRGVEFLWDIGKKYDLRNRVVSLTGAFYDTSGYKTYAPYKVIDAGHWSFAGTDVEAGQTFGDYSANRPLEAGRPAGPTGASGWEMDTMAVGDFTLLAIGGNRHGPAFMVFKEQDSGGWIFNAASITFTGALQHDAVVDTLMLNLIGNALQSRI